MEFREVLNKISKNAIEFECGLNDKITSYQDEKEKIQKKLDKLFDDQAVTELNGGSFENKKIDQLSAEIVRLNGLISALERRASKGYEIPESDRLVLINAAAEKYYTDTIQSIKDDIRLEEINKQLWDLMDEQKGITQRCYFNINSNLDSDFKCYSPLDEEASSSIISEAKSKADVYNNPEYIKLRKELGNVKTNYPYFWKKFIY